MGREPDYLDFIKRRLAAPQEPARTVAELRRQHSADLAEVPRPPVGHVEDLTLDGPAGPLPARLYRPSTPVPPPVLVYLHGGGWALGDVEGYDPVVRALTVACEVAFVSVDYRRPPEDPFPAAVDDADAALTQITERAAALGVDPGRVGVAGDSAGAQIATATALRRAHTRARPPVLQLLVYPVVDLRQMPPEPRDPDGLVHPPHRVERVVSWYLNGADPAQPKVSPLLAPDLSGMPPTIIATAEYDMLCAQGEAYARRLTQEGVPTTLISGTGLDHGYLGWGSYARRPAEAISEIGAAVRAALA